jgi:hypothetical protein|tara:strand:- start:1800 stop:2363 length:564 start_codon:yes stop_codon:yes gene_type:complete
MAEKLKQNQFDEQGVNPFNSPIPGESLTTSPDMQKNWERPPRYTDPDDCIENIYLEFTSDESLPELVNMINQGIPLDDLAQVALYKGYTEGLWTPDVMLMLIEPTLYLLICIADYAGIKDYVLYEGEEDDPDTIIMDDDITPINADEDEEDTNEKPRIEKPSKDVISSSLLARIETELPEKLSKEKE